MFSKKKTNIVVSMKMKIRFVGSAGPIFHCVVSIFPLAIGDVNKDFKRYVYENYIFFTFNIFVE